MPAASTPYRVRVRDWPEGERPREKLTLLGPEQLSDAELLAILLRTGSSGSEGRDAVSFSLDLLTRFGGVAGINRLAVAELVEVGYIGPAKATTLKAAFEIGRRALMADAGAVTQVRSAQDVASLFEARLRGLDQEQLHVVLLSTRNNILKTCKIYEGNATTSIVRPAEVFRDAIKENAVSIIVAHNHPSGDPTPSPDNVRVTRDLVAAGKLLDIELLDHLVIGDQRHGYVSLRERKLGFES